MEPKIAGHSGCEIAIVRDGKQLIVRKTTAQPEYFARLRKQADKQEAFFDACSSESFSTPRVLRRIEETDCVGMEMEYIYGRTFVDYFENAPYTAPARFCDRIIAFLEHEFARSPVREVPPTLITEKWDSVRRSIARNDLLNRDASIASLQRESEKLFLRETPRRWPIGVCHGDLTFSNLLFQEGRIFLIDFLDSFIESPLMDLVKLRQDTRYLWSHLLCRESFDRVKSKIIMAEIDRRVWEHFSGRSGVASGYRELQCMNFWRILQYAHDPAIIAYLKERIAETHGVGDEQL